jgi:hypothetical protein
VWEIRRTTPGRLSAAATWSATAFVAALVGGFLFFGIDEVGRAAVGVEGLGAFWLSVLSLAVLVGFLFGVVRMLRHRSWIIDRAESKLVHRYQRAFNDPDFAPVPLESVARVLIEGSAPGAPSRITVVFDDGARETLLTTRLGRGTLTGVRDGIVEALDGTGIDIDDRLQE